jgi:PAS domain-containing protein
VLTIVIVDNGPETLVTALCTVSAVSRRPVFPPLADMVHHSGVPNTDEWRNEDLVALAAEHALPHCGETCGIVVQATSGAIMAATALAEEILGLTFEEMTGRTSTDPRWATVDEQLRPLPGSEHPAMRALAKRAPVLDGVMGVHRPRADPAGKHVWLSVSSVPIRRSADGPFVVLTAFSVLTGLRAVELQLMEAEANFRFIAENSSDMVAWQRFDTTYLWVSPASVAVLRRPTAGHVGGPRVGSAW